MISRIVSAGLAFVGLYFITRYLGPEIYGSVAFTIALVGTFNVVADLGINTAHVKRVSEGRDLSECLSTYITVKAFLIGLMVLTTLLSVWIWTGLLGNDLPVESTNIILIFILYFVFMDLAQIATVTYDALIQTAKSQLIGILEPMTRVPLVVIVSLGRMGALHLAYAYMLAGCMMAIGAMLVLSRSRLRWKRPSLLRSYITFALPLSAVAIMNVLSVNLDKIMLGSFWNEATVGYYAAAQSILTMLAIIGTAVNTLIFPTFSRYHSDGNMPGIRNVATTAERYILALALPLVTVIVLLPSEVSVILLGPQFASSGGPMRFLALSVLLNMLNGLYLSQINALNRPDITAKITSVSVTINIVLLLLLIPSSMMGAEMFGLGATGAAIANLCFFISKFVLSRSVCMRMTGIGFSRKLLLYLMSAGLTGILILAFSAFWPLGSWIDLIIYGLISVGAHWIILFGMKELKKEDIEYFLSAVNPLEMISYIKNELRGK